MPRGEITPTATQAQLRCAAHSQLGPGLGLFPLSLAGPDLRSVAGACTPSQLRNLSLCNSLQEVHRSLATLLPRMHPAAAEELRWVG